ncbi:MAG: aminoglycoside phosphotransferase family protein [Cyanobacteria bacterium J06634_5]
MSQSSMSAVPNDPNAQQTPPKTPEETPKETPQKILKAIAANFVVSDRPAGHISSVEPLGNGNINSTFLVTTSDAASQHSGQHSGQRFVLQRINTQVFTQPEQVIQNMVLLNEHLSQQSEKAQKSLDHRRWETPQVLPTTQGKNFWKDEQGHYWRAITFVEEAQVFDTVNSCAHAREVGYGLAMFHSLISTLSAERLADTLKGFHITPQYLAHYQQVRQQVRQQAELSAPTAAVRYCLNFIEQRQAWAHVLEKAKAAGHLQLRPIHGDPKVNNMMLGADGKAVSLIDLDTIKPGLVHYDIGDCLRSGCNPLGEETEDWQAVVFDTDLAKAMLEGYLSLAKDFLTEQDYDYLYDAIRLIAFELGLRFFTDHLAGNVYFKVTHPAHNLHRALVQFKLTESIENQADTLKAIIENLR